MNLNPNSTYIGKRLLYFKRNMFVERLSNSFLWVICLTTIFVLSGFYSDAQIKVSLIPPVPIAMSPCQETPFYLSVNNANATAQSFALVINLGQDQTIDTNSLHTLPVGLKDTITIAPITGYQILTIYTTTTLAAGATDTIRYSVVGLGCVPNLSAYNLSQTLNITNVNGTIYSGAGGYVIGSATASTPYTLNYTNATPNLTPVTSTTYGLIDTIGPGQSSRFRAVYVNSGPVSYYGAISVDGAFPCMDSNNITVTAINIYVHDTTNLVATLTGPITSFPVQFCNLQIDSNTIFIVEEKVSLSANSCLSSTGCTALLDLRWGCSTACGGTPVYCHNNDSTPIPLAIAPKPVPFDLKLIRILPVPPAGTSFPWENVCEGVDTNRSENTWKFVIENDGVATADNVVITLASDYRSPRILNTFIRKNSIHVNQPDSTLSISSPIAGVKDSIVTYKTADFAGANPLACYLNIRDTLYPMDTPIKSLTCTIPLLAAGQKMVVAFKTYRCCAWDNTPNVGVFYNHWTVNVTFETPCQVATGIPPSPPIYVSEVGFGTSLLVDTPHNTYGYTAWTTWHDAGRGISLDYGAQDVTDPDLALTQDFNPENTNLAAPTGGCGDTSYYHIRNDTWNTTNNNSDDFDAMIFSTTDTFGGTGTNYLPGEVGVNPQGQFIVDFNYGGANLHVPGNTVNMIGVINGYTYTWPSTSVTPTATGARAVFDISILNGIYPIHTSLALRYFMVSSYIDFGLYMCCSNPVPNPTFTITTSFNATPGTCPSCIVPLSAVSTVLYLHCPGCVTPGLISDKFTFRRQNLGLSDWNNDRRPDGTSPITPSYPYYGLVSLNSSIIGDTLLAISSGYMKDGDSTQPEGFNLSQWQTAIGNDTLFSDFYLEQNIAGSDTVGLSCISATLQFYHSGVLTNTASVTPVVLGTTFIYHVTNANFNRRLVETDRFTLTALYQACTNPPHTIQMPVTNIMYVTKGAESLSSDPFNVAVDPHTWLLQNDSGARGVPAGQYILAHATPPPLFWCEGFGGKHRVFPLLTSYTETWTDYDNCTKTLAINVLNQIGNPLVDGVNLFPFEYRTVPSVLPGHLINGPTLSGGDPIHYTINPLLPGYTITPTSVSTAAPYLHDPLHVFFVTSTVAQAAYPNQRIIEPTASTTDWMVNLAKVEFITPDSGITAITNLPLNNLNPSLTLTDIGNSDPELLVGDEIFSETMYFNAVVTCSSVEAIDTIVPKEASTIVPGKFRLCTSTDYRIGDSAVNIYQNTTVTQNGTYLHAPHPNITAALNPIYANYPHTVGDSINNLIVLTTSGTNFTTVPNVYFYVKIATASGSTLPPGISVASFSIEYPVGFFTNVPPIPFTVGGTDHYLGYAIPNYPSPLALPGNGSERFHISFLDSECYTIPPQVVMPVHYVWSCDTFPSGLPLLTNCSKDTFVTISYQVPVVNLYSQISAPSTYSTCNPITVVATLLNQQLGGAGHFVAHITLPNIFSIATTGNTLQLVPPLGSPHTVTISGASITHVTDVDTSKQDWTIRIDSLTDFSGSSLVGTSGLNNASGPIKLTFSIIAGCNTPSNDTIRFAMTMNGWRFCNLLYFNPLVPGDLNDTFPSVTILPASGTAFNGCGPYLALASTNINCYGNTTGTITVSPTVSSTYGATPVFKYTWSPTEPNTPTLTGLSAGIYALTVTDTVKHCVATKIDTVTQPTAPLSVTTSFVNASFGGCNNGKANAIVSGGTPGYTYAWSTTPTHQTTDTAVNLSPGTTYTVTVTDSKGCSATASVILPTVPNLSISGSSFICSGAATILNAGAGDSSYVWSTTDVSQTITVSTAGTYSVTVTKSGCTATASFVLSTSPLPDPICTITGYEMCTIDSIRSDKSGSPFTLDQSKPCTQVCSGSTSQIAVTLSAPGDSVLVTIVGGTKTYNAGLSNSTTKVYNIVWGAAGQGSITVDETYLGGCSTIKSFCIDILASPKAKFGIIGVNTSGTFNVCSNNALLFSDSSTITVAGSNAIYSNITGWDWNFGDGTGSTLQNPSHTFTAIGTYLVILNVSSSCNCIGADTLKVVVDSATALDIQCPSVVCNGGSALYTAIGCSSVTWTCIGGTITSHSALTANITWSSVGSSGFGYVTATATTCSCKPSVTAKIPVITHNAAINGPTTICVNNDSYFNLPLWPGGKYAWSIVNGSPNPSAFIVAYTNESEVLVKATSNGNFTLKVKYTDPVAGCSDSSSLAITVVSKIVDSASPAVGCVNNTVRFTLSNSAVSQWIVVTPNGVADTLASGASVNSATFVPTLPGNYTVNVTSPNVCIDAPLIYQVNPTPNTIDSLAITGPQLVCRNTPFTYLASIPAPSGTQYVWTIPNSSDGSIVGSNIGNSVIVKWTNPVVSAVCMLSVGAQSTNGTTCVDTNTKRLLVTLIEPDSAFYIPLTVCPNAVSSAIYAVSNVEDYYTWSFNPSNLASCVSGYEHSASPLIMFNNVSIPTTVHVILTVTRCNKTVFKDSTVTIQATPTVTISGPGAGCTGTQLVFTATPSQIVPGTTYTWSTTDGSSNNAYTVNTFSHGFLLPGTNWVNVTAHFYGTCISSAVSAFDTINILQAAPVNLTSNVYGSDCISGPFTSAPLNLNPATYASTSVWTLNGATISAAAGHSNYTATSVGNYEVRITDNNGCIDSAGLTIAYCPPVPPTCPGGVHFNTPLVNVNTCTDVVSVQTNYNVPIGYSYAGEKWGLASYIPGPNGIVTGSTVVTSIPGSLGAESFQVINAGSFSMTYYVYLRTPVGDTTTCSYTFNFIVPLKMGYDQIVSCNSAHNGYTLSLEDNSTYAGTHSYVYSWTFSPTVTGSPFSGANITTGTLPPGQIYNVTYNISGTGLPIGGCSSTFADTVPLNYPIATFNYTDTPLTPNPNRSSICQGFSITLQPTTPLNNNWTYHWNSTDGTNIIAYNPPKEYGITVTGLKTIGLTVTDQYGCSATASKTVTVNPNNMIGDVGPHATLIQNENAVYWCPGGGSFVFDYEVNGGGTPVKWKWYNAASPNIIITTNALDTTTGPAGRYLCLVTDVDGCQAISSPAGAVQTLPMPAVAINGKRTFCFGDTVKLAATPLAKVSYYWTIGSTHYTVGPNWNVTGLAAGTYTATLSYTDTFAINGTISQTCTGTAPSFTFTIDSLPVVTALLDTTRITCNPYSVGLKATGTAGLTAYTWSNGAVTQNTQVYMGGDYRVWLTGPGACTAHSDILVPDDPAFLIQYVPYGCYTYSCTTLYTTGVELDGPPNRTFRTWAWDDDGITVSGHTGTFSVVAPYTVNVAGDYSLSIYDVVDSIHNKCSVTSPLMHVTASPEPCHGSCSLHPTVTVSDCIAREMWNVTILVNNTVSPGASYNLTSPSGTFTGLSPATLPLGHDTIRATFDGNIGVSGRVFMVITLMYSGTTCQDTVSFTLPTCTKMAVASPPDDSIAPEGVSMRLMPNPASDMVNVIYSTASTNDSVPTGEALTLSLTDVSGQEIEVQHLVTMSGLVTINVSPLASGMYFVTLRKDHIPLITDKLVVLSHR